MAKKKVIRTSDEGVEFRYASWLKMMVDLIQPKNLFLPLGRGGAKTTDILAERTMDCSYELPGASFALVGDTYMNLQKNVVKSLLEGWERKGWVEGIHYVIDVQPPKHFKRSFNRLLSYKHSLSVFNGATFTLVSMDRPSSGAGNSYLHLFGDEAKYLVKEKVNKLMPAIRGDYARFGHSPYYRGMTFTSDMPNPIHHEDPWILEMEKLMDKKQINLIIDTAFVINDIRRELYFAQLDKDSKEVERVRRRLDRWLERYDKIRRNSTLFYVASSYINADILTEEFFADSLNSLGADEYKVAVLSMKAQLDKGTMFYGNLDPNKHFYKDGFKYNRTDGLGLLETVDITSEDLKYLQSNRRLECGVDFGNMMSMYIGQKQGDVDRGLLFLYTLTPEWIEHLAVKFLKVFGSHGNKVLVMRYDRAGNNYRGAKKDLATELQQAIMYKDGKATGWTVLLRSVNQKNITHTEEFTLVTQMLLESNPRLPKLRIDAHNCKEVKSSLELAPLIKDRHGNVKKDKRSEKLPLHRLPLESTNPSDAFKYYICKPDYLAISKHTRHSGTSSAGVRG